MELYAFGFNPHAQLHNGPKENIQRPTIVAEGSDIRVLWTSWCDAIITVNSRVLYRGEGLASDDRERLIKDLQHSVLQNSTQALHFFGPPFLSGVQGYISPSGSINIYNASYPPKKGQPNKDLEQIRSIKIRRVAMADSECVVASINNKDDSSLSSIILFDSMSNWCTWLSNQDLYCAGGKLYTGLQLEVQQLIAGATSFTLLSSTGKVYTWCPDGRHPRCLGREVTEDRPADKPCRIEYLSLTKINKIASGGYLTAALSEDGEMYLWGQPEPSESYPTSSNNLSTYELDVFARSSEDEDQLVKLVDLNIEGYNAIITDIAVGVGHVLCVAEAVDGPAVGQRRIFAAGHNHSGQLGLGDESEFVKEFKEVEVLRGKDVKSLAAAGWSSWAVVTTTEK